MANAGTRRAGAGCVKLLVDMNLSPRWCAALASAGHEAVHWSEVGDPRAPDLTILEWARLHEFVILTHDLDFSDLLAHSSALSPSVVQLRGNDVLPETISNTVIRALSLHESAVASGAILSIDIVRARLRLLPLGDTADEPTT